MMANLRNHSTPVHGISIKILNNFKFMHMKYRSFTLLRVDFNRFWWKLFALCRFASFRFLSRYFAYET